MSSNWGGAEEWMPLAWELCANEGGEDSCEELIWEGGPIKEPWGARWLKYEGPAKEMIAMVRASLAATQSPVGEPPAAAQQDIQQLATWHDKAAVLRSAWDALQWHCENPPADDLSGLRLKADQRAALGLSSLINSMEEDGG